MFVMSFHFAYAALLVCEMYEVPIVTFDMSIDGFKFIQYHYLFCIAKICHLFIINCFSTECVGCIIM